MINKMYILWSLQITIPLTEGLLLIFMQSKFKKLLLWPGIEPTNIVSSYSGACDLSAMTTPI